MAKMQDEQYLLLPCSGRKRLGIPRGHLYKVKDREGTDLGFFVTLETADKKFGKGSYFISGSDTMCKICNADYNGELEGILLEENPERLGPLDQDKKTLINAMNQRYLGEGRLGPGNKYQNGDWTKEQRECGAQYALSLLEGSYLDPETGQWHEFDKDKQMILEKSLSAVMDLFQAGHGFLHAPDLFISDVRRKAIGKKIIEVVRRTEYTSEIHINRGLRYVLAPGIKVFSQLKSTKETWLDPDRPVLYDKNATKRVIAELIPLIGQRFAD